MQNILKSKHQNSKGLVVIPYKIKYLFFALCVGLLFTACADKNEPVSSISESPESLTVSAEDIHPESAPESVREESAGVSSEESSEISSESTDEAEIGLKPTPHAEVFDVTNSYGFMNITKSDLGFEVTIPQDWTYTETDLLNASSGFKITGDEPAVEIRAYFVDADVPFDDYISILLERGGETSDFVFIDGTTGKKLYNSGEFVLYTYESYDHYISFFVNFANAPEWYAENTILLESIGKSLRDTQD